MAIYITPENSQKPSVKPFTTRWHICSLSDGPVAIVYTWWRHQIETLSALLAICAENSPVPGEFPAQRPVTRGFDIFFELRLNKRLSKQWWGWRFETLSHPLWRHRNEYTALKKLSSKMKFDCIQPTPNLKNYMAHFPPFLISPYHATILICRFFFSKAPTLVSVPLSFSNKMPHCVILDCLVWKIYCTYSGNGICIHSL